MVRMLEGCGRYSFPELLRSKGYLRGVEVGVAAGDHAVHILGNWPGFLTLVDCWRSQTEEYYGGDAGKWSDADHERNYDTAMRRLESFMTRITVYRAKSTEAACRMIDASLDFVYLDANHSYSAVRDDLVAWYPKLRPGGMMSGHDFVNKGKAFGVRRAVLEFIDKRDVDLYVAREEWPTWHFFKGGI